MGEASHLAAGIQADAYEPKVLKLMEEMARAETQLKHRRALDEWDNTVAPCAPTTT
jgi:hypothetical protein